PGSGEPAARGSAAHPRGDHRATALDRRRHELHVGRRYTCDGSGRRRGLCARVRLSLSVERLGSHVLLSHRSALRAGLPANRKSVSRVSKKKRAAFAARSSAIVRSRRHFTLMTSDSSTVFLRYINSRPVSVVFVSGTVAVVTCTEEKLRGATVPNGPPSGSPVTPKRALPGVNSMFSTASVTSPLK